MPSNRPCRSPARVAAGRLNRLLRKGLTAEGRERLRQAALANRPWQHATGPTTAEGKARSALNGRVRQKGELSARQLRAELAEVAELLADAGRCRRLAAAGG
jgi:hypothetical protein